MTNNPCHNGSDCSHICTMGKNFEKQCDCPEGMMLDQDGLSCTLLPVCEPNNYRCISGNVGCIPMHWR